MADAKPRSGRRLALGTLGVGLVWLVGVWPPPLWWRDHWPRATAMMRERSVCATASGPARGATDACPVALVQPTALEEIAPVLQRMIIIAEDSRFRTHHGIDPVEIADAVAPDGDQGGWQTVAAVWRARDRLRGASTITQQLAKNLYLSSSRNPLRKLKEAATALGLELALSKDRILELYLDVAEWGPGIWGAERASRTYFGVSASRLNEEQAAALAVTLPHPESSNPAFHPEQSVERRELILARYRGAAVRIPPDPAADSLPPPIPPAVPPPPPPPPPAESLAVPAGRGHGPGDSAARTKDSLPDRAGQDTLPRAVPLP